MFELPFSIRCGGTHSKREGPLCLRRWWLSRPTWTKVQYPPRPT